MDAERDVRWLLQRLREEEDLRPRYRRGREQRWVAQATVLRDDDGGIMAYTEVRKHLCAVELTTVVIDPLHRGKGLSHALVDAAVQRTTARPLILFTRAPALETAAARAGFMQRRIWNPLTLLSVGVRAVMRLGRMLMLGDVRKVWAQAAHVAAFRCWVLSEDGSD